MKPFVTTPELQNLTYGQAFVHAQKGKIIAREAWGDQLCVKFQQGAPVDLYGTSLRHDDPENIERFYMLDYMVTIKRKTNEMEIWYPSRGDIFASDWYAVDGFMQNE